MKHIFLLFAATFPILLYAQVSDSFTDGDFTDNPHWAGDSVHFEVNAALQLRLKGEGSDTSVLATQVSWSREMQWDFWIKLSFNTSANNHARVYLLSDTPDLSRTVRGYYLQAGGSNDSLSVIRQDEAGAVRLLTLTQGATYHSVNVFRFRITRDEAGYWEAAVDTTGGGMFLDAGSFFDDTYGANGWFGLYCRYTSSNSTKIYFDDVYAGPIVKDTVPPSLVNVEIEDPQSLLATFSETLMMPGATDPHKYTLMGPGMHPDTVIVPEGMAMACRLRFPKGFTEGSCDSLWITGIADAAGNAAPDTIVPFCLYHAKAYDIIIDEVMADPEPANGLPGAEYVELFNRSSFPVSLKGWSFGYGYAAKPLPAVSVPPKGYVVLTGEDAVSYFANAIPVFTSATSLSNEGTTLALRDNLGRVIHTVSYSSGWYRSSFKKDGGWSLEMADPSNPCGCDGNWSPSVDPTGGTPGRVNSVSGPNPDTRPPVLLRASIVSGNEVRVILSEPADSSTLMDPAKWQVIPGNGSGSMEPGMIVLSGPAYSAAVLSCTPGFDTGVIYRISCGPGITDCAGNLQEEEQEVRAAIPAYPWGNEVRINEILPDPDAGGSRYIELYNMGDKPLDLYDLMLSYRSNTSTVPPSPGPLTEDHFVFFPGGYAAICEDPEAVATRYLPPDPSCLLEMDGFPALSAEGGKIFLLVRSDSRIIDSVSYDKDMQYPLLANTSGVSLERIRAEGPSGERTNWHSASAASGYGTPGYKNSQSFINPIPGAELKAEPAVFSPDNDGFDDLLTIKVTAAEPGSLASVTIFDERGRKKRILAAGDLMAQEDVFLWDGLDDMRQPVVPGLYIVYAEVCRMDGTVHHYKTVVAVAAPD